MECNVCGKLKSDDTFDIDEGQDEVFMEDTDQETEFQLFVETYQLLEPLINEKNAMY